MNTAFCIDEREKIIKLSNTLRGINWQEAGKRFTKSYWEVQYHLVDSSFSSFQIGVNLKEEVVACLLGGYGLKAELGLLAFHRIKNLRLISSKATLSEIENAISTPFMLDGNEVHYRFPHQKSKYIFNFLHRDDIEELEHLCGSELRNRLLSVKGIGPKTASWIARNYGNCEDVAIVDIHIYRAGRLAGFVNPLWNMQKDYYKIEKSFLDFCHSINALPSKMDSIMWNQMKESNKRAIELLNLNIS